MSVGRGFVTFIVSSIFPGSGFICVFPRMSILFKDEHFVALGTVGKQAAGRQVGLVLFESQLHTNDCSLAGEKERKFTAIEQTSNLLTVICDS